MSAACWWIYERVVNGFEIRVGCWFFWVNFFGVGIGRLDPLGLGRGQLVHYWRRCARAPEAR